jgi:hypothetical protein
MNAIFQSALERRVLLVPEKPRGACQRSVSMGDFTMDASNNISRFRAGTGQPVKKKKNK